ncbi:MAG: CPBP family intramembrane glutamic endopeptidase [Solirubrobacterales bacterium]
MTVFLGVLAVLGITFVAAVGVSAVNPDLDEETFGLIIQAVFAAALFLVPLALVPWPGRFLAPPALLGLRRFKVGSGIGWTLAAYGGFFIFLITYGLIVQPEPQEIIEEIQREKETVKIVALGVLIVLAAPISEELFFRGFLFGGLRGKMAFWPAALISGLIFGLIHLPGGALQVPPLAIFGVLLAWLYEKTGSIWPPIMMHMIQNAISFAYTISS